MLSDKIILHAQTDFNIEELSTLLVAIPPNFVLRSIAYRVLSLNPTAPIIEMLVKKNDYEVASYFNTEESERSILHNATSVLKCDNRRGHTTISLLSNDLEAESKIDKIASTLDEFHLKNEEENGVWLDFSMINDTGKLSLIRQFIKCPIWQEIDNNYQADTRNSIETIMSMQQPWEHGRLIIWHGSPGTGKTYAIRSTMMAWRNKYNFVVITDPEKFAASPDYYFKLAGDTAEEQPICNGLKQLAPSKRTLFILEDSADLIMPESRAAHYDKVGKLLNITDGLFGQGREDMFLITFNEKVDRIDPAFIRPGRCVANIEFSKFSQNEAKQWLENHQYNTPIKRGEMTLAEMFELINKSPTISSIQPKSLPKPTLPKLGDL